MTTPPETITVYIGIGNRDDKLTQNEWAHLTDGTDLDYVLYQLDAADPIDIESEDPSDTDYEVHKALNYVRAQIARRKAVQAGPRTDVDYCGVDDKYGRACGPDLGLPQCGWHGRVNTPAAHTTTAAALDAANPKEKISGCPDCARGVFHNRHTTVAEQDAEIAALTAKLRAARPVAPSTDERPSRG